MPQTQRSKPSIWIQAIRPFAFPASLVPVFIGAALAFRGPSAAAWVLFPVILACALLFHSGTNIISEYFDFQKGLDKDYTFGSSRVLVDGLLKPAEVLIAGYLFLAIGFLLGLILVYARGLPVLILGIIGLAGGIFYSCRPIGYKYLGWGDVAVFLLMGPLMAAGTYFTLTGTLKPGVIYVSLPIGFLVAAILNANNIRDIKYDRQAKITTMATLLGYEGAKKEYFFLITAVFLSVAVMIIAKVLPLWSALTFLSLPAAFRNMAVLKGSREGEAGSIVTLDAKTAQLHLLFGTLLFISVILGRLAR